MFMARLELWYPVKPFIVGQHFGVSEVCVEDIPGAPISKRKVRNKVAGACPVGFVDLYPILGMRGHTGLDLAARRGQEIRATIDGVVEEVQTEPERGLGVGVVSHQKFDLDELGTHYVKTRDWHLMSIAVRLGQEVRVGDLLGLADNTGISSGDHDHFELKPVEINTEGKYYNVFQSNGYFGAIDSMPFFNGFHAADAQQVSILYKALIPLLEKLLAALKK